MINNPMNDISEKIEKLSSLDGQKIDSFKSTVSFSNKEKLSDSPSEAINQARADALKKGSAFPEPANANKDEIDEDVVNKYVDDLLEDLLG